MIFILEGPDGAGKSTLAKKLKLITGYDIVARDRPKSQEDKDGMMAGYKELIQDNKSFILDRSWYSEMVYGKIVRGENYIDKGKMIELEALIIQNGGGVIIHCTNEIDILWDRCQVRGEDYITDRSTLDIIRLGYHKLFDKTPHMLPVFNYKI